MVQNVSGCPEPTPSRSRGQDAHASAKVYDERVTRDPVPSTEAVWSNPGHARLFPVMSESARSSRSLSARERTARRMERSVRPGTCEQSRTSSPCRLSDEATGAAFNLAGNSTSRKLAAEGNGEQPGSRANAFMNCARSSSMNRRLRLL